MYNILYYCILERKNTVYIEYQIQPYLFLPFLWSNDTTDTRMRWCGVRGCVCCSDSLETVGGGVGSQDALSLAQLGLVQRVGELGSVLPQLRPHRMTALVKPVVRQHTHTHRTTPQSAAL